MYFRGKYVHYHRAEVELEDQSQSSQSVEASGTVSLPCRLFSGLCNGTGGSRPMYRRTGRGAPRNDVQQLRALFIVFVNRSVLADFSQTWKTAVTLGRYMCSV
jgi:hypothetical protein